MVTRVVCLILIGFCQVSFAQQKDIDFKTAKKRGDITLKKKEYAHAIEHYRKAIAVNPSCFECKEGIIQAKKEQRKELQILTLVTLEDKVRNDEAPKFQPKTSKPTPLIPVTNKITLSDGKYLEIGKLEITQAEWENYCLINSLPMPVLASDLRKPNNPIVNISYTEAIKYVKWLSAITGDYYDLPTQEEWELARGNFFYGNTEGWFYENADRKINDVGQKSPNVYGLYDMEGNVSEWVNDWYHKDLLYEISDEFASSIKEENKTRLVCGCSIRNNLKDCRKVKYIPLEAGLSKEYIGFRIIKRDLNE